MSRLPLHHYWAICLIHLVSTACGNAWAEPQQKSSTDDRPAVEAPLHLDASVASKQAAQQDWHYLSICDALPARCFGIAAADADGDNDHDLAIGQTILLNPERQMNSTWKMIELGPHIDANAMLDIRQDGKIDILAQRLPDIVWLEAKDTTGTAFEEHVIATGIGETGHGSSQGFVMADVTGDGREDYVLTTGEGIFMLPIPDDPLRLPWARHKLTDNAPEEGVAVGDIDHDGLQDVVAWVGSGSGSNQIGWWKNPGGWENLNDPQSSQRDYWDLTLIGMVEGAEGDRVAVGDFNQDGQLDVVGTGTTNKDTGSSVYWFQNPGQQDLRARWIRTNIVEDNGAMNSLAVGDLNADGALDVVTGEHRGRLRVQIWLNSRRGSSWNSVEVDRGKESHLGTQLFDLDGDGDLEIVSIAWDDFRHVHLWRNDTRP